MFKDLFLHFSFLILPILYYEKIWLEKESMAEDGRHRLMTGVTATVSVLLCLLFPHTLTTGFALDLALIPLLISLLYGGDRVGIVVLALYLLCRCFSGEASLWTALLTSVPAFAVARILMWPFWCLQRTRKQQAGAVIGLVTALACMGMIGIMYAQTGRALDSEYWVATAVYTAAMSYGMSVTILMIEGMRENLAIRREVQRSEKLHMLGQIAASIAHEVRNPMTVARGFLQLFSGSQISETNREAYVKLVISELDRAQNIINDYLALAKPLPGTITRVDVSERIRYVVGVMSSYATLANVDLSVHVEDNLPIQANGERIAQVLLNVIKNGIESMPGGGALLIRAYLAEDEVVLDIIDTGVGMTREELKALGNPFHSSKETGTGLGMMVCFQIIEELHGKIEVSSEKGQGTHFSIILPAARS